MPLEEGGHVAQTSPDVRGSHRRPCHPGGRQVLPLPPRSTSRCASRARPRTVFAGRPVPITGMVQGHRLAQPDRRSARFSPHRTTTGSGSGCTWFYVLRVLRRLDRRQGRRRDALLGVQGRARALVARRRVDQGDAGHARALLLDDVRPEHGRHGADARPLGDVDGASSRARRRRSPSPRMTTPATGTPAGARVGDRERGSDAGRQPGPGHGPVHADGHVRRARHARRRDPIADGMGARRLLVPGRSWGRWAVACGSSAATPPPGPAAVTRHGHP